MACITTVPPSIILSLHQINLRHVRVSAIMMPLGRHLQRRGPGFTCSQNLQTLFTTLENLEKVAGGTLHTYERKLYPHNKAEKTSSGSLGTHFVAKSSLIVYAT